MVGDSMSLTERGQTIQKSKQTFLKYGSKATKSKFVWTSRQTKHPTNRKPKMKDKQADVQVSVNDFQNLIHKMYFEKDAARGIDGTFMWLMEEVGELATALRTDDKENLAEEFADVLAWLATIANVAEIDLTAAITKKYGSGCPGCQHFVCSCPDAEKP